MEHCIYHSKDLDGLTSAAIIYSYQKSFGEDCILTGYDYGEKLDTRKFKGKTTLMIDVSMEMERMEMLGTNAMEFIWIDHHVSAMEKFLSYCLLKGYTVRETRFNDLIKKFECYEMNVTYFYSERLSGCEMAHSMYGKMFQQKTSSYVIKALGQYDTWRNTDEKKFVSDIDWSMVMNLQYYMRTCRNPMEVFENLVQFDTVNSHFVNAVNAGISILKYQKNQNMSIVKSHFEVDINGLKVIALNTPFFNSQSFETYYAPEVHDAMMPFIYDGKLKVWKFSLYTTKDDADILNVAKLFGGGGHAKACGFSLPEDMVRFTEGELRFISSTVCLECEKREKTKEDYKKINPKSFNEKPSRKSHVYREHGDHGYLVPNLFAKKFDAAIETGDPLFTENYSKYKIINGKLP